MPDIEVLPEEEVQEELVLLPQGLQLAILKYKIGHGGSEDHAEKEKDRWIMLHGWQGRMQIRSVNCKHSLFSRQLGFFCAPCPTNVEIGERVQSWHRNRVRGLSGAWTVRFQHFTNSLLPIEASEVISDVLVLFMSKQERPSRSLSSKSISLY